MTAGAVAGLIEDAATGLTKFGEGFGEIVDAQGDVVQAGAPFFDEFGDGGVRVGGFEEFDAGCVGGVTSGKHGDGDLFDRDGFGVGERQAEGLGVKLKAFVDRADGDSEMVDFNGHGGRDENLYFRSREATDSSDF